MAKVLAVLRFIDRCGMNNNYVDELLGMSDSVLNRSTDMRCDVCGPNWPTLPIYVTSKVIVKALKRVRICTVIVLEARFSRGHSALIQLLEKERFV